MRWQGTRRVAAPPDAVWAAITDLDVVGRSLPGCERLQRLADGRVAATVTTPIGPMAVTLAGTVSLHDIDPPRGCRIEGEGESATGGSARGRGVVRLASDGQGTRVDYEAEASVGGKLAQLEPHFVKGAAEKATDEFFARFSALVEQLAAVHAGPVAVADARRPGLSPLIWVPGLITLVIGMLVVVASL